MKIILNSSYQVRVFEPKPNHTNGRDIYGIVLGNKIGDYVPILTKDGFQVISTSKNVGPMMRDSLLYEAPLTAPKGVFGNPARTAINIQKLWNCEELMDYSALKPRLKPGASVWATFYENGQIRAIKDQLTANDRETQPYAELLSSRSDIVVGQRRNLPPHFEDEDLRRFNWDLLRPYFTEGFISTNERVVLGVKRNGFIPVATEAGYSLVRSNLQAIPILSSELPRTAYNIQRLWDYDGLWDKEAIPQRLCLGTTWIILDRNEHIAMLKKEEPETIPYGYKITKIEPIDHYTVDGNKIKISSLNLAIQNLNFILTIMKPPSLRPEYESSFEQDTLRDQAIAKNRAAQVKRSIFLTEVQTEENNIPEDKITAVIIFKLMGGKDLNDSERSYLQGEDFKIKDHKRRLKLIENAIEHSMGKNFEDCRLLGRSKTIVTGLSREQLLALDSYVKEKGETQDRFANGLAENEEFKRLLAETKQ